MIALQVRDIVSALSGGRAHDPLGRLRWFFTCFAVLNATVVAVSVGASGGTVAPELRLAAILAAIVIAIVWVASFRRQSFGPLSDLLTLGCLSLIMLAIVGIREPEPIVGALFANVFLASLYGSFVRAVVRAVLIAGLELAPALLGQGNLATSLYVAAALIGVGVVAYALPAMVHRYDEGARRGQILASAGLAMVAAVDTRSIVERAVEAAHSLCDTSPDVGVWLVVSDGAPDRLDPGNAPGRSPGAPSIVAAEHAGLHNLKVAAVAGAGDGFVGRTVDSSLLPNFFGSLDVQRNVAVSAADAEKLVLAGLPVIGSTLLLTPIAVDGVRRGFLGIGTSSRVPTELAATIAALVTQTSLAISRADLQASSLERQASERFRALVQNSSDAILIVDTDCRARFVSPSVQRLFGYPSESLVGQIVSEIVHAEDVETVKSTFESCVADPGYAGVVECRIRHADGSWRFAETRITNLVDEPAVGGMVLNTRDVTDRHNLEAELRHQAFHDGLTGLANRALFMDRVKHATERARREGTTIAVLFIDLDGFKRLSDSLGYAAGDTALQACADRLRSCVRTPDTVARLSAEEFAVLLDGLTSPADATLAVERIIGVLRQPLALPAASVELQPHIGIAVSVGGDDSPEELLRNGAVAMHRAKTLDGGYTIFDPEMHAAALRRLEVESQLRRAIEEEQLVLHYQPTIDLNSGVFLGVEALVRWQHPTRGMVPPLEFIPLAEETGLIVPLGRWVMREACRQVRKWQQEIPNDQPLSLSVNLSGRQLRHPTLVRDVADALDDSGMLPGRMILELTESVLMTDTAATLNKLFQLKSIGVRLAIDDFGTGYSSFSYLRRFPIDILKIDKSFVDGVGTEPTAGRLIEHMIGIGKTLRMETVAEGVERAEQAQHLRDLKCDVGQGYLFSRPLSGDALTALLLERERLRREGSAAA